MLNDTRGEDCSARMGFTRAYDVKLLRLYFGVREWNGDVNLCSRASGPRH